VEKEEMGRRENNKLEVLYIIIAREAPRLSPNLNFFNFTDFNSLEWTS